MSNTYIPTIFKDKISLFFNYFISFIFALLAVFIALSLITFSIRDNSFLTSSDQLSTNFFGDIGSYVASFILYTFGIMGYSLVLVLELQLQQYLLAVQQLYQVLSHGTEVHGQN